MHLLFNLLILQYLLLPLQPKLLILDEPTAGVDIEIRRSMWNFLKQINAEGITIILTTHYLEEAESLCNKIAIIDKGITVEQTDMKTLLSSLNNETFVLDLNLHNHTLPASVEGCEIQPDLPPLFARWSQYNHE